MKIQEQAQDRRGKNINLCAFHLVLWVGPVGASALSMLRALLFLEFDVVTGVVIRAQCPPNAFGAERLFLLGDELIFSAACHSDANHGEPCTPLEPSFLIWDSMSFLFIPVMMRNDSRYPRGVYRWSLVMVFDTLKQKHFAEIHSSGVPSLPPPKLVRRWRYIVSRSADRLLLRLASLLLNLECRRFALSTTSRHAVAIPLEGTRPSSNECREDPIAVFIADIFTQLSHPQYLPGRPLPLATCLTVLPLPWPPRMLCFRLWQPPAACPARPSSPLPPLSTPLPPLDAIPHVIDGPPLAVLRVPVDYEAPPPLPRDASCRAANGWGNLLPRDIVQLHVEEMDASAAATCTAGGGGVDLITELIWPWLDGQTSIAMLYVTLRRLRMQAFAKLRTPWDRFCGQAPAYAPPLVDLVSPLQLQRRIAELVSAGLLGLTRPPCLAIPVTSTSRRGGSCF